MPLVNEMTEDKERGEIPESFPGVLLLQLNDEKDILQDQYRKLTDIETDENNRTIPPEVVYFHEKLLPNVKGKKKDWKKWMGAHLLSEIYSVSEEAFALLIIDNELDMWNKQFVKKENGLSGRALRLPKKYCQHDRGSSWLTEDLLLYDALKVYIGLRRKTRESDTMERHVQQSYRGRDTTIVSAKPTIELSPFARKLINKLAENGYNSNGIKTRENTEIVCGTVEAI